MKLKNHYTHESGFSLIEVLIALFLLSLAFFGIGDQMLNSLQNSQEALNQTVAIEQLDGLANMMREFPDQYQNFLSEWNNDNHDLLPDGNGTVNANGGETTIQITWRSGASQVWQCKTSRRKNLNCLELMVAS